MSRKKNAPSKPKNTSGTKNRPAPSSGSISGANPVKGRAVDTAMKSESGGSAGGGANNPASNRKLLTGMIKRHADGFGFLIPENVDHADVYISKHSMTGIMTNDRVFVEVFKSRGEDRFHGEIIRVVSRGTKTLVGRLQRLNDLWYLIPDESKGWGQDLKIKASEIMTAKEGDLVEVEIIHYPGEGTPFSGKVIDVLGNAEDPLTDVKRVLRSQNIPDEFSPKTLSEVAPLKEDPLPDDWKGRRNLMNTPLITIDGATAKDFDDAVFTESTSSGFHLIVAIADVSHYVKTGTSLDQDAYDRGTSVYFPNFVVPMLPEILSNGLCSLKPNVPRLCMVADMHFNFQGELTKSEFYEAVMKSQARVTYGEAQEIIDGASLEQFAHVKENILRCSDLAKILMARRFREGSLDLNISQTVLEIDASGNPIDVQKSERLFAHRLIEELMLAANVAVAQFIESKEKGGIYRIHEDPSPDAIKMLDVYLHNLGSKVRLTEGNLQKQMTKVLEHFANHAEEQIINILTLRSLSQAKYSSNNIGHFGLGFSTYTHFTSPIRRYPDLIVHRLLKHFVVSESRYPFPDEDLLTTSGNILSASEQRAVKCERQFMSIKKARFIQKFVDQEFTGLVSSVARFGVFVLLREFDIDGLVKLENLGDDRWVYDEDNLRLIGDRSKHVFKLGQVLKVRVTSVDVELGQINFDLDDELKVQGRGNRSSFAGRKTREIEKKAGREAGRKGFSQGKERNRHESKKAHNEPNEKKNFKDFKDRKKEKNREGHQDKPFGKQSGIEGAPKNSSSSLIAEIKRTEAQGKDSKIPFYEKFKKALDRKIEGGSNADSEGDTDWPAKGSSSSRPSKKGKRNQREDLPSKRSEGSSTSHGEEKKKSLAQKLFSVTSRLKKSNKETSENEDHRNRKDTRKNSEKRGKTKNNSRRLR